MPPESFFELNFYPASLRSETITFEDIQIRLPGLQYTDLKKHPDLKIKKLFTPGIQTHKAFLY